MIRVFIFQEVLSDFRIPFFNRIGRIFDLTVFYCEPTEFKNRKTANLDRDISFKARKVKNIQFMKGKITLHPDMIYALFREKPDIVILEARLGFTTALLTAILPKKKRRIAWWLSGYEIEENKIIKAFKYLLWKKLYAKADAYICYGTSSIEYLKKFGVNKNTFIAYNSLDSDELNFFKNEVLSKEDSWLKKRNILRKGVDIQLLYVGRIESSKKLPLLLQSIHYLKDIEKKYTFRLLCVGGGTELQRIKDIAKSLEIDDLIEFTGSVYDQRRLAEYFLSSDIFVLPGTGGLAVNQAITYGLPVILASADGTERDMVYGGVNGLYFIKNNAKDLADKINYLSINNGIRKTMSEESIKIASEISNILNMVKGFIKAIEAMIDKKV